MGWKSEWKKMRRNVEEKQEWEFLRQENGEKAVADRKKWDFLRRKNTRHLFFLFL